MSFKVAGLRVAVALVGCLLAGCRSNFHLVLFNDTDDPVIVRLRDPEPNPRVIYAEIGSEITGVSTDTFTIERRGQVWHYRMPTAFTYPSNAGLARYERHVRALGTALCFQLAPDNRIYLLARRDDWSVNLHSPQPSGFPLVPR